MRTREMVVASIVGLVIGFLAAFLVGCGSPTEPTAIASEVQTASQAVTEETERKAGIVPLPEPEAPAETVDTVAQVLTWPNPACDTTRAHMPATVSANGKHYELVNDTNCKRPFTMVAFHVVDALRPKDSQVKIGYAERYLMPGERGYFDIAIAPDCYQTDLFTDMTEQMAYSMDLASLSGMIPQSAHQHLGASCQPPETPVCLTCTPQIQAVCPVDPLIGAPVWTNHGDTQITVSFIVRAGIANAELTLALYKVDQNGTPAMGTSVPQKFVAYAQGTFASGAHSLTVPFNGAAGEHQADLYRCVKPETLTDLTVGNISFWASQEVSNQPSGWSNWQ